MQAPVARSPREDNPPQLYHDHVVGERTSGVACRMEKSVRQTARYMSPIKRKRYIANAVMIGLYHDIGKLDKLNQDELQKIGKGALPIDHADAGSAILAKKGVPGHCLVFCHHSGLGSFKVEKNLIPVMKG